MYEGDTKNSAVQESLTENRSTMKFHQIRINGVINIKSNEYISGEILPLTKYQTSN